tara:strand:- start:895 stop:1110 length:216 start_codon:yes stop_codon:yes gene_type:complete
MKNEINMNFSDKGNWNIIKEKLKEKYGEFTENELAISEGEQDQVIGMLQKKLGKTKNEIMNELSNLMKEDK